MYKRQEWVCAGAQAKMLLELQEQGFFTEEEEAIIQRGRNASIQMCIRDRQTAANYTGYLEASSEIINGELVVHLVYHNNGLNPNTNEEVKKLSVYEMNNARINAHYTKYAGGNGSRTLSADIEKKPLDGETTLKMCIRDRIQAV